MLSFELFSYLLIFNPFLWLPSLPCSLPFFLQDLYPFVLPALNTPPSQRVSAAAESYQVLSRAEKSLSLFYTPCSSLTGRQTTAPLFFPGAVTLLIPLQMMCLPPQAASTLLLLLLLLCVPATVMCVCPPFSGYTQDKAFWKLLLFPTPLRTGKAKFCFPKATLE